jgi:signal transduction histidine kinase/DNA-binding response OmpR family regulator/HPt (histidine-containing phosphotransfer) domain-containing protein
LLIGIPAAVGAWMVFYIPGSKLRGLYRANIAEQQASLIQAEKEILEAGFDPPFGATRFLSSMIGKHLSYGHGLPDSGLQQEVADWARDNSSYLRIVFSDETGREAFRIEKTPNGDLEVNNPENKTLEKEDYFRKGMKCGQGQTYVSRLSLETSHGSTPPEPIPVLHLSMPVFSPKSEKLGLVVVTLSARTLLERLKDNGSKQRIFLVNPDGYWILGPAPEDEWGFQDPRKSMKTMGRQFPGEWSRLASAPSGQFTTGLGLFTYALINPLANNMAGHETGLESGMAEENWKLVSWVPEDRFEPEWGAPAVLGGSLASLLTLAIVWQWARARRNRGLLNLELENRVEERTADLRRISEELRTAKEVAEGAAHTKSAFMATMSHEIRTPLNAIIGFTNLARRTDLSPKQQDYLLKIQSSSSSLLGIVNDILDFSKIEAGKLNLENSDFLLEHVLDKLGAVLNARALGKSLELVFVVGEDVPKVLKGDPLRLEQILINLGGNAVKFTESGEIVVSVSVHESSQDGIALLFSVRDTGIGISPEQQSRLFRTFSQADSSTTRKFGGTGLGLAICKQLVELMGGTIRIRSEAGKGSTFEFTLAFGRAADPSIADAAMELDAKHVLVVDDNPLVLEAAATMLKHFSIKAMTAPDAATALRDLGALPSGFPLEAILFDYDLPDMNAREFARRVRNQERFPKTPLITMANSGRMEDAEKSPADSFDGILSKPLSGSALYNALIGLKNGASSHPMKPTWTLAGQPPPSLASLKGARVLLVEDNEINQQVAQELLEAEGLVVTLAGNGRQAVEVSAAGQFDVILMDVQMPEMDGPTATKKIRENPRFSGLPIIAMTANVLESERAAYLEAGMNDFIAKPIDVARMHAVLLKWVKPPGNRQASGPEPEAAASGPLEFRLEGIDSGTALQRLNGNASLYARLLLKFRERCRTAASEITEALDSGKEEDAERLAHTLKGLAATIGADALAEAARIFEASFKNKEGRIREHLIPLSESLEGVYRALAALPGEVSMPKSGASEKMAIADGVEWSVLSEIVGNLRGKLSRSEAGSAGEFRKLLSKLEGSGFDAALSALGGAVEAYDFESAEKALEILWQELEQARRGDKA